jgi:hypothetical protein
MSIRRVEATPEMQTRLVGLKGAPLAQAFAVASLWYDALDARFRPMQGQFEDGERAALLEQVGLDQIAAYLRARSPP